MTAMQFGLISDTHGHLHPDIFELFKGVEAIFHAGDVCGEELLDELAILAPVHAVGGNCDPGSPRLPMICEAETAAGKVLVSHSHLVPARGNPAETLAVHFASRKPRVIVYGHTHKAYCGEHHGIWVVNPGAAGKPRFNDVPSVCVMTWDSGAEKLTFDFKNLDWSQFRRG